MLNVKRLIEIGLPEESLLRNKAWRNIEPDVKIAMAPYSQVLRQAVEQQEITAAPDMIAYIKREAEYAGTTLTQGLGAPLPSNVVAQVGRARVGKTRFRELFNPKQGPITPWTEQMFRVVDRNVRSGIMQGLTTEQIADQVVHETISRGVKGVSLRGQTSVRTIRSQAMAMARTVTQDVNRQIKEEVWDANEEALDGFVYQWSSALDSRTCPTCAPLDGRRYDRREDAPTWPVHVNCRCQLLAIDPEDKFWAKDRKTGQQVKPVYEPIIRDGKPLRGYDGKIQYRKTKPFSQKGAYKTPVTVNGEKMWRRAEEFSGSDYSDYLATSTIKTQTEFFGGGPIGQRRARYFRSQIDKVNKDPQEILASMLTGPTNAKKFIPVP